MEWRQLHANDAADLRTWLEACGPTTINLQDLLDAPPWGRDRFAQPSKFWVWSPDGNGVENWQGVVALRAKMVYLPCLLPGISQEALVKARAGFLRRSAGFYTLLGTKKQTSQLEPYLPFARMVRRIDYDFMVRPLQEQERFPELPDGVEVVKLTPSDALGVFPLQEAYEKEEVLFHPSDFQPLASRVSFHRSLNRALVVALRKDGRWICKGGTNAWGRQWAQLGGVYTLASERQKGWQKVLMQALMYFLAQQGRGACLFVKKANTPALNLYSRLGFQVQEDFEISYWER